MEQKDLDFIRKFEKIKNRKWSLTMVLLFLLALMCCSIFILLDVIENGSVEVTLPYFMKKFSLGIFLSCIVYFFSYIGMRKKYKKLKEKEKHSVV